MRSTLKNRQTFKNHRDALLKHGVDIAIPPRTPDVDTVIPIWDEAYLIEATIPAWAIGTNLYFEPNPIRVLKMRSVVDVISA